MRSDNGLLGARAYDFAERRKIQLLKDYGYNAIRSAHNPCSKAILQACDQLGMLVMDEYMDVWYIHKNLYDYAGEVETNYPEDLRAMVEKDYNHPSVIMYSIGNEVSETGQKRGIDLCDTRKIIDRNMTIGEMNYGKSPLGWFAWCILTLLLKRSLRKGRPDLNLLFIYNMPLRGLAKMTSGIVSMGMVDGIVMELKGFWVIGFIKGMVEYLKNARLNKSLEKRLTISRR